MADFKHNGHDPEGFDVTDAGVLLVPKQKARQLVVITNASAQPIYLALKNSTDGGITNQAVVGNGIYLAPEGGAYEINNTNQYTGEIWAIHDDAGNTHRICVQRGS